MSLVDPASLSATLDAVNEALFFGRPPARADRIEAARWIASRQGLPGSYAGMFAPLDADYGGMRLFTGDAISTGAATRHILGEEACRAIILLDVGEPAVRKALARASAGILVRIRSVEPGSRGTYCCGRCSVALWRHLAAGGLDENEPRLAAGLRVLQARRHDGGWRTFPLHYTLLALSEIDLPQATREMRYVAPALERSLKRKCRDDKFARRRRALAERVLARC